MAIPVSTSAPAPAADVSVEAIRSACAAAERALAETSDDRQAIDAALERLTSLVPALLVSIYVLEHERLWLLAQRGYDQVRDGFGLSQGVIGRAVRTGKVQVVRDVWLDPDFIAAATSLSSEIALPFGEGRPASGIFNVETRGGRLSDASIAPLAALTGALADRARATINPLGADLSALARLFVYASSLHDVGQIAELAVRSVGRFLGVESVQLNLLDGGHYAPAASFWRRPDSDARPLPEDVLARLRAYEPEETYGVIDARSLQLSEAALPPSLVWLPLRVGGQEVGTLVAASMEQMLFAREQSEVATLFAAHVAALLDAALALEQERRVAALDSLTNLLNRRGFQAWLEGELERAARDGSHVSVLLLDCDDLKALNSRGGHLLGDRALQAIADCLRAAKRPSDVGARLGGDEFAVVLPDTDPTAAVAVAERVRRTLAAAGPPGDRLTVSIGTATYPLDAETRMDLLRVADQALFAAKHAGKDRSVAWSSQLRVVMERPDDAPPEGEGPAPLPAA